MTDLFFDLLNLSLGNRDSLNCNPTEEEWRDLFLMCQKQSVAAFVLNAIDSLCSNGVQPPKVLLLEWIGLSEETKARNCLMNNEAARLTELFESVGHRTAILKGQANARLYPRPLSRQPGDIDIWLDGGQNKAIETIRKLGILKGNLYKYQTPGEVIQEYHHLNLPRTKSGVDVELHFRPTSGHMNPFKNKKLQDFLEKEINVDNPLVEEGFRIPGNRFSLVMQLSHIQRHFISEGVGMRQIIDYYYLLRSCEVPQQIVSPVQLKKLGLAHSAGALMWLLHEKLGLEEKYLIYPIDVKRGKILLDVVIEGGNFGFHYVDNADRGSRAYIIAKHKHRWQMLKFDASETIWQLLASICFFLKSIPERVRRRKWSLA